MFCNINTHLSEKTILVVEDMLPVRELLKCILHKAGCGKIYDAEDGTEAIRCLNNHYIDMVISDWMMPKMDGFELLKNIRSDEGLNDILFLMVTGDSDKDSVIRAMQHDVSGYIVKPFTPRVMLDKIIDTLKKQSRFKKSAI